MEENTIGQVLRERKVSRRDFLKFCAAMAGTLALPAAFTPRLARALEAAKKPTVVWLEYQNCAGCVESLLRAARPTVAELILDVISLDYSETIMSPAGRMAEKSLDDAIAAGGHIVMVDGSIPLGAGGSYCCVGGKSAVSLFQSAVRGAAAVMAVGTCAAFGGIPAAAPNPTDARAISDILGGTAPLINLPGCPPNVDNITATVVHYLSFGSLPPTDQLRRPLFAYGERIHDHCERRSHFDAGQYVQAWGDEGHRAGWCLYKMGCKGPQGYLNCPAQRWNGGVSWPVGAGHGCIACAAPRFWDTMTPFYRRLPDVPGFGVESTADTIGLTVTGITAAAVAAHVIGSAVRSWVAKEAPSEKAEAHAEPPEGGAKTN